MKSFLLVLLVAVTAYCAEAQSQKFISELELEAHHHIKLLHHALVLGKTDFSHPKATSSKLKFSFDNCAKPSEEVVVVSGLDVKPNPIKLPGTLEISGTFNISKEFGAPLTAKLTVHKKFLGLWIKVPCIDDVGSCTYKDFCPQLKKIVKKCPEVLVKKGFNCTCPFKADYLKFDDLKVSADVKIPSIADGEIKVEIELTSGKKLITCVEVEADLK